MATTSRVTVNPGDFALVRTGARTAAGRPLTVLLQVRAVTGGEFDGVDHIGLPARYPLDAVEASWIQHPADADLAQVLEGIPAFLTAVPVFLQRVKVLNHNGVICTEKNAGLTVEQKAEVCRRANAYPQLLVVLQRCRAALRANGAPNCEAMKESSALLAELGEAS